MQYKRLYNKNWRGYEILVLLFAMLLGNENDLRIFEHDETLDLNLPKIDF